MQENQGNVVGVHIVDPWKGLPGSAFFAFSDYFFNSFYAPVGVNGEWFGKRVFIAKKVDEQKHNIVLQEALSGGSIDLCYGEFMPMKRELLDVINFDLSMFGFGEWRETLAGGLLTEPIKVIDLAKAGDYYVLPVEQGEKMAWNIVDLKTMRVESVCFSDELTLYSYNDVENMLSDKYTDKKVKVEAQAYFDSTCPVLFSKFDLIYKVEIDKIKYYCRAETLELFENLPKDFIPNFDFLLEKSFVQAPLR